MKVNILEAKTRLSELIRAAQAGEEVIIASRGKPVAKLTPVAEELVHPVGSAEGILEWMRTRPAPTWPIRSAEEINADIQSMRDE